VSIVAASDASAARRAAFLEACPDARWYESVTDLLSREDLDFVDICTPPGSHMALIKQALDAGLHVLCEKPLVTRVDDAREVAAAATRARRTVYTVHNWLYAPICLKISALISEGAVGDINSVQWQTLRTQPAVAFNPAGEKNWRIDPVLAGGGILSDHGWHALYCVARWAGPFSGLTARLESRRFHQSSLEDTATLDLDLNSGTAHIYLTWAANERSNYIEIEGKQGRIRVAGNNVILASNSGEHRWSCPPALSEGSHHPDWFVGVAKDFQNAAVSGSQGNLNEAVLCAQAIDLAQRSSADGGVRLSLGD
jgi:predicted dehydrogenase